MPSIARTDEGVVGWSEFDEGFGSPGVSAVIERLAGRVVGQPVFAHERIYTEDGHLVVLDEPGWGTEPNEEAFRAIRRGMGRSAQLSSA